MNQFFKVLIVSVFSTTLLAGCGSTAKEESKTDSNTSTEKKVWSYDGETGPSNWEALGFIKAGKEQSPINIQTANVKSDPSAADESVNYSPTAFKEFNNGHTIEAIPQSQNDTVVIDGVTYTLAQFHFHTPSEHQIDGKNFDMELHLVNKDASGNIAVLGVLIKEGAENKELANMWDKLPANTISEEDAIAVTGQIDLMNLLPVDKTKYEYKGSLTTPPCTEKVKWYVFSNPIEMSKAQIDKFKAIFKDDHRPVQPLNDREVLKD